MARLYAFDNVGSEDVVMVIHYPGGWRTIRKSDRKVELYGLPQLNSPFSLICTSDDYGDEMVLKEFTEQGDWIASRFFAGLDLTLGRRYPHIMHYMLGKEMRPEARATAR